MTPTHTCPLPLPPEELPFRCLQIISLQWQLVGLVTQTIWKILPVVGWSLMFHKADLKKRKKKKRHTCKWHIMNYHLTPFCTHNPHAWQDVPQSQSMSWNEPFAFNNAFKLTLFYPWLLSTGLIYFTHIFYVIMLKLPPCSFHLSLR